MFICIVLTVVMPTDIPPSLPANRLRERGEDAILASTVLVLRRGQFGPEVLLLKRNPAANNMASVWMFPGGKVDENDSGCSELDRFRSAAVRELFEEAGITLATSALSGFSHWLTPVGMKRRFATWFFVAELPDGAMVKVDGEEMVEAQWIRPADALAEHKAENLRLPPPTVVSLIDLASYHSVDETIDAVQQRVAPYFLPKVCAENPDDVVMLYPGDAGYEKGDRFSPGARHRAGWTDGIITYERSFDFPLRN